MKRHMYVSLFILVMSINLFACSDGGGGESDGDLDNTEPVTDGDGETDDIEFEPDGDHDAETCLGCTIDSACIPDGQVDIANTCQVCDAARDASNWSLRASGEVCREAADTCDLAETCDGSSVACPVDQIADNTVVCREVAGLCDVEETCDGISVVCPADQILGSTVVCREAAGLCDIEETCDGSSAVCPADQIADSTVVCRAMAGSCDIKETCDGSSAACPADRIADTTVVCREAGGLCDVEETCDGLSVVCPADQVLGSSYVCREAGGLCDIEETCDGSSAVCPADEIMPVDTLCRDLQGDCDLAEYCDGTSPACPTDEYAYGIACDDSFDCSLDDFCSGEAPGNTACIGTTYSYNYGGRCISSESASQAESDCRLDNVTIHGGLGNESEMIDVFVQGTLAYVTDRNNYSMTIFDISDPDAVTEIGRLTDAFSSGYPYNVYVRGEYAFVTGSSEGLKIVDVSTPASPRVTGSYDCSGTTCLHRALKISGNLLFATNSRDATVQIIDISDPTQPTKITHISADYSGFYEMEIRGSTLFINDFNQGLKIYDISTPGSPVRLSTTFFGGTSSCSYGTRLEIVGNTAYTLSDNSDYVNSIDISNLNAPVVLQRLTYLYPSFRNIYANGNLLYVTEYDRVTVIDVSDPANMEYLGTKDLDMSSHRVGEVRTGFVSNGRVYAPHWSYGGGLAIADIDLCRCSSGYARTEHGCQWAAAPTQVGDVKFSEFMADSGQSTYWQPEWVEIRNDTDITINLEGCTLTTAGGTSHTFGNVGIPENDQIVVCNAGNRYTALMTPVDEVAPGFYLEDGGDTITLTCGDTVIDEISYLGASVDARYTVKLDPDSADYWCSEETQIFGDFSALPLYGTPGEANPSCSD